jgi:hypothetical protein
LLIFLIQSAMSSRNDRDERKDANQSKGVHRAPKGHIMDDEPRPRVQGGSRAHALERHLDRMDRRAPFDADGSLGTVGATVKLFFRTLAPEAHTT